MTTITQGAPAAVRPPQKSIPNLIVDFSWRQVIAGRTVSIIIGRATLKESPDEPGDWVLMELHAEATDGGRVSLDDTCLFDRIAVDLLRANRNEYTMLWRRHASGYLDG